MEGSKTGNYTYILEKEIESILSFSNQKNKIKWSVPYMDNNIYENQIYLNSFLQSKYPEWTSCFKQYRAWKQYESTLLRFMNGIQKDIVTITETDIKNFLMNDKNPKTISNKEKHIKSLLSFILKENISSCRLRASEYVLVFTDTLPNWLLSDTELFSRLSK